MMLNIELTKIVWSSIERWASKVWRYWTWSITSELSFKSTIVHNYAVRAMVVGAEISSHAITSFYTMNSTVRKDVL